jgi:hypothetical protein
LNRNVFVLLDPSGLRALSEQPESPDAWFRGMDNYRDLVSAALALLCAGVMLVAGHLSIEWRAKNGDPGPGMEAPKSEDVPSPLTSNGSSSNKEMMELPAELRWKRAA